MKIKVGQRLMMMVIFLIIIGVQSMAQEGKKFKIGISQFAEHPALDDVRKGFDTPPDGCRHPHWQWCAPVTGRTAASR